MKLIKLFFTIAIFALTACSGMGTDNTPKPTPLARINPVLSVKSLWSIHPNHGASSDYLKLAIAEINDMLVVVSRDGSVTAIRHSDGGVIWHVSTGFPLSSGAGVSDNFIVVGAADGHVIALNTKDGKLVWEAVTSNEILAAPRIKQGRVFVKTIDGTLTSFEITTGKISWTYSHQTPVFKLRGSSVPDIAGNWLLAGFADGRLVAFSAKTGQVLWEHVLAIPQGISEVERLVDIDVDPIIDHGIVYAATYQGNIAAVQLQSGEIIWQRPLSSYTGMALKGQLLFVSDAKSQLWALNRKTGDVVWQQTALLARNITAPVVMDDSVVVADGEGYVHWLTLSDGHFMARMSMGSNAIVTPPFAVSDKLYVYDVKGKFAAYSSR